MHGLKGLGRDCIRGFFSAGRPRARLPGTFFPGRAAAGHIFGWAPMGSKNRLVGTRFRPTFYGHNPGAQQELSQALPRPRAKTWVIFIRLTSNLHHLKDLGEYFTRNRARGDAFFDHFLWPQSGRAAGGAKSAPTAQGKNMGNMHPFELNHAWFKRSRTGLHPRFFQRGTTSGGFRARFSLGGRLLGTFLAGRPWGRKIASWGRVLGPQMHAAIRRRSRNYPRHFHGQGQKHG